MKVHLVDGTYELFRAHYGAPPAEAPDGLNVGGTRGLLRSMIGLLREPDVTHVACAFDTVIESFRNELYDGYKTGAGIEPELKAQFPLVEEGVRALGIVAWSMIDHETDDALATAATRFSADERVDQVVIASPDKDFAQCVRGDRVVLLDRRRQKVIDEAGVVEKWGVSPASIPDWLALVGDTADGFPGVPRWGAKSSATVLAEYKHIDAIPDDASQWSIKVRGAAGLAKNLAERRADAQLFRKLATLVTDVPLAESLDDLRWTGPDEDALGAFGERVGDDGLLPMARAAARAIAASAADNEEVPF